jgi:hypothetical protein
MKKLPAVVLFFAAALTGCAGSRDISLRYAPDFPGVPAGTGKTIVLAATEDARAEKELGVLTGFNAIFKKPPVRAPGQDVPAWVSGAIAAELGEAGFRTVREGEGLRLETRLKRFHVRAAAEIRLEASLRRDGEVLFNKEYAGRAPAPFMGGAAELEESFQDAMRQINLRLVYDVIGKL